MSIESVPENVSEPPVTPARNPRPRPALRIEGDDGWVVAARPLPGLKADEERRGADEPGDDREDVRSADRRKGKGKGGKRLKSKDDRRRKDEKKKNKDITTAARSDDRGLAVTLPPDFRRALETVAAEHGLTPENLAAYVLVEWLDR